MPPSTARKPLVLLTVCVSVLAINIDTTIVNVALPTLGRELDASTRDLLWIVDGYNLSFAALVLAMGSLSDKWGRRPALLTGLGGFALASGLAALVDSSEALIALRFVMGTCAALIFPRRSRSSPTPSPSAASARPPWACGGQPSASASRPGPCRAACCWSTSPGTRSSGRWCRSPRSRWG